MIQTQVVITPQCLKHWFKIRELDCLLLVWIWCIIKVIFWVWIYSIFFHLNLPNWQMVRKNIKSPKQKKHCTRRKIKSNELTCIECPIYPKILYWAFKKQVSADIDIIQKLGERDLSTNNLTLKSRVSVGIWLHIVFDEL